MGEVAPALACAGCGAEIAPALLACPACRRLVHAETLKQLAAEADARAAAGDRPAALATWRRMMELLPADSRQHAALAGKIAQAGAAPPGDARAKGDWSKRVGVGGAIAFLLTKGKLLLVGLTKMSTLLSMLLSFGVYWQAYGWRYAAGLIASIYVHEMGHVAALQRLGIAAQAPMFIPGFGAVVRLTQYPQTPREDATVGLAGPVWGLGAALAAYAAARATGGDALYAIARSGAYINLFNLIPVWQLDGSRGLRALARGQRWLLVAIAGGAWAVTSEGILALLALVLAVRAAGKDAPTKEDWPIFARFAGLIAVLSLLVASIPRAAPD